MTQRGLKTYDMDIGLKKYKIIEEEEYTESMTLV